MVSGRTTCWTHNYSTCILLTAFILKKIKLVFMPSQTAKATSWKSSQSCIQVPDADKVWYQRQDVNTESPETLAWKKVLNPCRNKPPLNNFSYHEWPVYMKAIKINQLKHTHAYKNLSNKNYSTKSKETSFWHWKLISAI